MPRRKKQSRKASEGWGRRRLKERTESEEEISQEEDSQEELPQVWEEEDLGKVVSTLSIRQDLIKRVCEEEAVSVNHTKGRNIILEENILQNLVDTVAGLCDSGGKMKCDFTVMLEQPRHQ